MAFSRIHTRLTSHFSHWHLAANSAGSAFLKSFRSLPSLSNHSPLGGVLSTNSLEQSLTFPDGFLGDSPKPGPWVCPTQTTWLGPQESLSQTLSLPSSAATSKPVISLHPPWTIIFKGEAVTLTCHESHFHAAEDKKWYRWYLGTEILREIPGNTIQVYDSGEYRCQIHNSPLSDGVSLTFSSGEKKVKEIKTLGTIQLRRTCPIVTESKSIQIGCR